MLAEREFTVEEAKPKVSREKGLKIFRILRKKRGLDEKKSLNELYEMASSILVSSRNEHTGLLPMHTNTKLANVYDNVSTALALWALSVAMNKAGKKTSTELVKVVKKVMVTMLQGFKYQVIEKDEAYYKHFPGVDPLVQLDVCSGLPADSLSQIEINQSERGASRMESVAFFLLAVVHLTAGGLEIIETSEDVSVIQNLVVYLQSVYLRIDTDVDSAKNRIKFDDPTMKISTVAMIKSAIDAFTILFMSGKQFGPYSVQVFQYEAVQLKHLLKHLVNKVLALEWLHPSVSAIVSYPTFAIHNPERREVILNAFIAKYHVDFKQDPGVPFTRDMMQVYCYVCLSLLFYGRIDKAQEYRVMMNQHLYNSQEEFDQMLTRNPGSDNSFTYHTCTSLFLIICLISFDYLTPKDIDVLKLSRPNIYIEKFVSDREIHVVVLTESKSIQTSLKKLGIESQLMSDLSSNFHIFSDDILHHFFSCFACNTKDSLLQALEKAGTKNQGKRSLSGYSPSNVFYTAQLYTLMKNNIIFVPRVMEKQSCYLCFDLQMFCDLTINNLKFLSRNWTINRTPLYFLPITEYLIGFNLPLPPELDKMFKKIKGGFVDGTRVKTTKLSRSTDQYYTFNLNLMLSDKSDAKEILQTMSSLSEYKYAASGSKGGKKSEASKSSLMDSLRFKGGNSKQVQLTEIPEDVSRAMRFTNIKEPQSFRSTERIQDVISNWRRLNLNWLPEQISSFIVFNADVSDGNIVPEEECFRLLLLYKSSMNFMEKAYTIKRLYNLRGINWLPPDWTGAPLWLSSISDGNKDFLADKKNVDIRSSMVEMFRISAWGQVWWMVRFTAGLIGARLENIGVALSDIVVRRRKQVIIGCTANNKIVVAKPHHDLDIMSTIQIVSRNNPYFISLLQELLICVWMVYQNDKTVFDQVVCVDLQAIYQAMTTDLSFRFECDEDMAAVYLACLSPYELKCFVEAVLKGDELGKTQDIFEFGRNLARKKHSDLVENIDSYLQPGVWLKRRSLDGVLMRLPNEFIIGAWQLLTKCKGLSFDGRVIKSDVTDKYSDQNLNFTAILYSTLRLVRPPELLSLVVEAIFLLSRMALNTRLNMEFKKVINISEILFAAVNLFLRSQSLERERSSRNCCTPNKNLKKPPITLDPSCKSRGGICWQFYDSAPTGEFGTMAFITDAVIALHSEYSTSPPRLDKQ